MSAEQNTLERSALERKDREELTTIAQALGAKPPSRARKADIVQLILELTGVESGGGETNGRKEAAVDDADRSAGPETAEAAEDAPADETPAAPEAASPPAPSAYDEEPPSEWEMEFGGTTDVPDSSAPAPTSAAGAWADNGQTDGEAPAPGAATAEAGAGGAQPSGSGQGGGGGGQGGDAKGGEQVDVNEPGNRRRRRRGRRGKDETTHVEEFAGEPVEVEGLLDLRDEGYGFLRVRGYLPSKDDIYVSVKQARQFGLRKGDHITGASRPAMRN
jgi:transcription termination factor Rho